MELADTSAWVWSRRATDAELSSDFDVQVEDGEIATCDVVRLELLHSARSPTEFHQLANDLEALPHCPITEAEWKRALWVYGELAKQGGARQRGVKHPDLLIAAAAEAAGVPVLHYDQDYERIADITEQPHRWLAEKGTLRP
jgi:predicted nucleic acid-binding protein